MDITNKIKSVILSGAECLPIIEGGKGIGASNGESCGAFAYAGAVGTFSGVAAQRIDVNGRNIPLIYKGTTRKERHEELMKYSIQGALDQLRIAYETASNRGRIHVNVLWEMAGAERILEGVLSKARGMLNGITCGAGMPYRLAPLASKFDVYYYPIISSVRAFKILWLRSYKKFKEKLGGVVYEDPWKAGGHNGISNAEDPFEPQSPKPRVKAIRSFMNEVGLEDVPIIMAGGVWNLEEFSDWLDDPEIGKITFQFGTRPVVTQESPVPFAWKEKLLTLKEGDVNLNQFSPTGFYSSAVNNDFLYELAQRSEHQVKYNNEQNEEFSTQYHIGKRGRSVYVTASDYQKISQWKDDGFDKEMRTPDTTLIFVSTEKSQEILKDQIDCMGCLSACKFSNWTTRDGMDFTTGQKPDPRSFCIQKTLNNIVQGKEDVNRELMFAGHNAYRFATDSFYKNGFMPTVKQLIDRIMTGK